MSLRSETQEARCPVFRTMTAPPPEVIRVNDKYVAAHPVPNVCGVIYTTNYKTGGLYLTTDDRRHYVAWSPCQKEDFPVSYWNALWGWYEDGGFSHVAACLAKLDLAGFNPKAPPPKTEAFWKIVNAHRTPESAELADVLELMGDPDAVTLAMVQGAARQADNFDFAQWLKDHKNRRTIPHRLEDCGYTVVHNPDDKRDGMWRVSGNRVAVYARDELDPQARIGAVRKLITR